jgi:hypothetical protein
MGAIAPSKMPKKRTIKRKDDPNDVAMYAEGGETELKKPLAPSQSDVRKADKNLSDKENRALDFKKAIVKMDLATARKQGKDYNTMYEDTYQDNVRRGILNEKAVKERRAYELLTPKEVRDIVNANPGAFKQGGEVSRVNEAGNYTKPGLRKRIFNSVKAAAIVGTGAGQWSARKAQVMAKRYKAAGGGYKD